MKIKEYNLLRREIYESATSHEDINKCLKQTGVCYLYEVYDQKQQHVILPLAVKTHINNNTLKDAGIDPETANVKLVMVLKNHCVDFIA